MFEGLVRILVALIEIFPDLLGALDPKHPITKRVREILPVKSKSQEAAEKLAKK